MYFQFFSTIKINFLLVHLYTQTKSPDLGFPLGDTVRSLSQRRMEPDEEPGAPIRVHISDLPDAIDVATYERNKHILIVDNAEGMASRFLRYQRGCYLLFHKQEDVAPESLRKNLIGALKFGSFFVLSFDEFPVASVDALFEDETSFSRAVMERAQLFKEETWAPMLRPDKGDPEAHLFMPWTSSR